MSDNPIELEPARPGRRRRYTAEQKRARLDEAAKPGGSISETARQWNCAEKMDTEVTPRVRPRVGVDGAPLRRRMG